MKLVTLDTLFYIDHGSDLELNKLNKVSDGINYVSRTQKNNGVSAQVEVIPNKRPIPPNTISVTLGGSVLEAFLQKQEYYTSYHISILTAIEDMSDNEKLFYCMCIRENKFRYNFGRQANKTIEKLKVPSRDSIPKYVYDTEIKDISNFSKKKLDINYEDLDVDKWGVFDLVDLFDYERGKRLTKSKQIEGDIAFVTAGYENQGVSNYIGNSNMKVYEDFITIDMFCNSFYRGYKFCCDDNIIVLKNKEYMSKYSMMFISTIINYDKFRYSYGRQYRLEDFKNHKVKLPINEKQNIDYDFMDNYIKSLNFTSEL